MYIVSKYSLCGPCPSDKCFGMTVSSKATTKMFGVAGKQGSAAF